MAQSIAEGLRWFFRAFLMGFQLSLVYGFLGPLRAGGRLRTFWADLSFLVLYVHAVLRLWLVICGADLRIYPVMALLLGAVFQRKLLQPLLFPLFSRFWKLFFRFWRLFFTPAKQTVKFFQKIAIFLFSIRKK